MSTLAQNSIPKKLRFSPIFEKTQVKKVPKSGLFVSFYYISFLKTRVKFRKTKYFGICWYSKNLYQIKACRYCLFFICITGRCRHRHLRTSSPTSVWTPTRCRRRRPSWTTSWARSRPRSFRVRARRAPGTLTRRKRVYTRNLRGQPRPPSAPRPSREKYLFPSTTDSGNKASSFTSLSWRHCRQLLLLLQQKILLLLVIYNNYAIYDYLLFLLLLLLLLLSS